MEKCAIVAVADNSAIGKDNSLLWHISEDLQYFKKVTSGSPVIMGYMTYRSIGRPLPRRKNIVISIFPWPDAPKGVTVVGSLQEAFAEAEKTEKPAGDTPKGMTATGSLQEAFAEAEKTERPAGGTPEGMTVTGSLQEAFAEAKKTEKPAGGTPKDTPEKCFVIGGGCTYAEAMKEVDRLYITHVHATVADADTFFPEISPAVWEVEWRSEMRHDEESGLDFEFRIYRRRRPRTETAG